MDVLVSRIEKLLTAKNRVVIAVAGVPGAGKSTLVGEVLQALTTKNILAQLLPQDGYHYYREELAKFDDPTEAFRRRGAPFTFNVQKLVSAVERLHSGEQVVVPLFDHSKKDPVEDDIVIGPKVRVVLVEGNYVGLKEMPWSRITEVSDELWLVSTSSELVRERIIKRHLASGIVNSEEEAAERADGLDWQNALYVMVNSRDPDVIVEGS